jgi:tRNA nucleotidyltransferase (CCA-adding enzyme)
MSPTEPERQFKKPKLESSRESLFQSTQMESDNFELSFLEENIRRVLFDAAGTMNTELRFVGGWVRDKLLGIPSHDIDVGINNMTGSQFGLKLEAYLNEPGVLEKYPSEINGKAAWGGLYNVEAKPEKSKHLATATAKLYGLDVDLVNLRKETYTEDSRNPEMEFGTPTEDASRRDATINALFYNVRTRSLEDFTGKGFDDLRDKIIRTPLDPFTTFKDDPLRILRLIRFASRLGFTIDADVGAAMADVSILAALRTKISRERVGIELEKMIKGMCQELAY